MTQILYSRTKHKVLCLCYTNHALDQFLEHLLKSGITQIVRIGGNSKSQILEPYNLRKLATQRGFSLSENRQYALLKKEIEALERTIAKYNKRLAYANSWDTIKMFLEQEFIHLVAQLTVPTGGGTYVLAPLQQTNSEWKLLKLENLHFVKIINTHLLQNCWQERKIHGRGLPLERMVQWPRKAQMAASKHR